jgi:hypothetical protein
MRQTDKILQNDKSVMILHHISANKAVTQQQDSAGIRFFNIISGLMSTKSHKQYEECLGWAQREMYTSKNQRTLSLLYDTKITQFVVHAFGFQYYREHANLVPTRLEKWQTATGAVSCIAFHNRS